MGSSERILDRLRAAGRRHVGDFMVFTVRPDERHPEIQNEGMKSHDVPRQLPEPPESWTAPYEAAAGTDPLPWTMLSDVHAAARSFLGETTRTAAIANGGGESAMTRSGSRRADELRCLEERAGTVGIHLQLKQSFGTGLGHFGPTLGDMVSASSNPGEGFRCRPNLIWWTP